MALPGQSARSLQAAQASPSSSVADGLELAGRHILLGVTGGVAAYKAAELTRQLIKAGATVRVAMTEAATPPVTPSRMCRPASSSPSTEEEDGLACAACRERADCPGKAIVI